MDSPDPDAYAAQVRLLVLALDPVSLAGCAQRPTPSTHSVADMTIQTWIESSFELSGSLSSGAYVPLVGTVPGSPTMDYVLPLGEELSQVSMGLSANAPMVAQVRDPEGHVRGAIQPGRTCTLAVDSPGDWRFRMAAWSTTGVEYVLIGVGTNRPVEYASDSTPSADWLVADSGARGAEATLGPVGEDAVLVVAGGDVLRWDRDAGFRDATPLADATAGVTLDPFLVADQKTGRIYVSQSAAC